MKIEISAIELSLSISDLKRILDAQDDDTVTIEAFTKSAGSKKNRVVIRGSSPRANFVELQIHAVAIEPGGASFRFREIAQAASAFHRGKITVGRSPASTMTVISLGDEKITLKVPNEEFETIDEPTGERTVFAAGDLLSVMMDVIHAQSYDYATRRSLCGVNFEVGTDMKLRAIATNGRCLAVSARQISCAELKKPEFSVFLPHAACDFLLHACRGEKTTIVKFDKGDRIGIENGGSVGYFYSPQDSFPSWRKCVPDNPSLIAKFDAVKVENALERAVLALGRKEEIQPEEDDPDGEVTIEDANLIAHLFCSANTSDSHMDITISEVDDDTLPPSAKLPEFSTRVDAEVPEGVSVNVKLNARYFLGAMRVMWGTISISAEKLGDSEQLGAMLFKCSTYPDFYEVIMPLRD